MAGILNRAWLWALLLAASAAQAAVDPMQGPAVRSASAAAASNVAPAAALVVTLVLLRDDLRVAWINDRPLRVGESIDGARVVAIERQGVQLLRDGKRETLWLNPQAPPPAPEPKQSKSRPRHAASAVPPTRNPSP